MSVTKAILDTMLRRCVANRLLDLVDGSRTTCLRPGRMRRRDRKGGFALLLAYGLILVEVIFQSFRLLV